MSNTPITLTGIGPQALPGVYGQINFAQGPLSLGTSPYSVLMLANIIQTATSGAYANTSGFDGYQVYGPDTQITMQSEADAISLFGAGSPAHLMIKDFFAINKTTPLYIVPVPQPTSATAATWVLTLTSTSTITSGAISIQIGADAPVVTSINSAIPDTLTTIAANIAANINATGNLPVIATPALGVITLTAKIPGARGNWLRAFAKVISGSGVTLSVTVPSFFTGGTGSDASQLQAVLASLATNGQRYYYYVPEAGADSVDGYSSNTYTGTSFADICSQIQQLALPAVGLRQRMVAGSVDSFANSVNVSTNADEPRAEIVCLPNCDVTPGRLAARCAAIYSLEETYPLTAQGVNFDGFGTDPASFSLWNIPAPMDGSAPSAISLQSATITGITPIKVQRAGRTSMVKRVTTRYYSTSSGTFDGRITDGGKVTICDQFLDDLTTEIIATFPRKLVADDPPAGSGTPAPPGVCTPALVKQVVVGIIDTYASRGLIDGVKTKANLIVQRETSPHSRISVQVGLFINELLHTVVLQVNQQ